MPSLLVRAHGCQNQVKTQSRASGHIGACLLALLAGCQAPGVYPAGCHRAGESAPRCVILTRQLLADSAIELTLHPLQDSQEFIGDGLDCLEAAGRGCFGKRLIMRLQGKPDQGCCDCQTAVGLASSTGPLQPPETTLRPARIQAYIDGAEALTALEQVIDAATHRIDVLVFSWDQGPVGQGIAARLAAKAGPELRVRVLVDGGANLIYGRPYNAAVAEINHSLCWLARQPYVEVLRSRDAFARFDHRKLVIVDGRLAWAGGRNLTEEGFFRRHDLSFLVAGPLAHEMDKCFECFWEREGGQPAWPLPIVAPSIPNAYGHLVYTDPGQHTLEQAVYQAVDAAHDYIYIENPYLTDGGLVYKLAQARRRGADVRVILSIETDTSAINHANRVTANRLLRAGVRVYLYPGWLHVKAAAVDGTWLYLGSGNFDFLSFRHNHELGVIVGAGSIIKDVEEQLFRTDLSTASELKAPLPLSARDFIDELLASLFM